MMVAVNPMTGLVAAADRAKDRVRIFGEDAVVTRVFNHERGLRDRGCANLPTSVG